MAQPVDPGLLIPGYSGRFYKSDGSRWATCTQWELQLSITSTDENPLGTFWLMAVAQSGSASLTVSELVIDDEIPAAVLAGIQDPSNPSIPKFRFIGERIRPDGLTSTLVMDGCTLDGTNRIAAAIPGETMTRDFTFRVSVIPDPAGLFPAAA